MSQLSEEENMFVAPQGIGAILQKAPLADIIQPYLTPALLAPDHFMLFSLSEIRNIQRCIS
jgi:hypothetical protein